MSNETKHTPGEWRYSPSFGEVTTSPVGSIEASKSICRNITHNSRDTAEGHANGYLLAAAKDLLAACERMVSYEIDAVASNGTDYDADSALADFEILRAAIAKAKGE